ncbi:MAG TPA: sigma-70 family RNA polymerase sigma factor [Vicinamibacterales bacterium]|nr:sigma-70 family RNA polymerase sigma factor [Vicinamibacterales bacterium]
MNSDPAASDTARLFEEHRRFLWRLSYRLTGNAADADDIIQETFVRAMVKPPADRERDWRPWLVRVALNLGRDVLRRRRRLGYTGPWLPSPIAEEPPAHEPSDPGRGPEARYELLESASVAFLLTLEALTPMQRAVLLLRDVFDYSVRETAGACAISEANVRTTHRRARAAMERYESNRYRPTSEAIARGLATLQAFIANVAAGDSAAVESLLSENVRFLSDGAGEFKAAIEPVVGRKHVAALFAGLARLSAPVVASQLRVLNGLAALVVERLPMPGFASRFTLQVEIDGEGRLSQVYIVLASRKLTAVTALQNADPGSR